MARRKPDATYQGYIDNEMGRVHSYLNLDTSYLCADDKDYVGSRLIDLKIHHEPAEGAAKTSGENGDIAILKPSTEADFTALKTRLQNVYNEVLSKANNYGAKIKNGSDDEVLTAKSELISARDKAKDLLRTFGTSEEGERVDIHVYQSGDHRLGYVTENWRSFTLKYLDEQGAKKSVKVAATDVNYRDYNISSSIRHLKEGCHIASAVNDLLHVGQQFEPKDKSRGGRS